MHLSNVRKFIAALIPAVLVLAKVLSDSLGDGAVSDQEWIALGVAFAGAVGVWAVPNEPEARP